MAKYNLIKNSDFKSVSDSPYNKSLTQEELLRLKDDNTTTSGVVISTSDYLCLEIDFSQRIKIDGIFLYTNDLTKINNINFYYKNYEYDAYSTCSKSVTNSYNATIPEPSAPRFIRCTVSGININLFEFQVFNDDYIIEFGEDGTESNTWLRNTPIGTPGVPQAIKVYNNNNHDSPVNAYVCVDPTGDGKNNFIKISKNLSGPYLGYEDGAICGYNIHDWKTGILDNLIITSHNTCVLDDRGSKIVHYGGYISDLPLDNCYYAGTPFGGNDVIAYAKDINKIYAIFYNGTTSTNGILKLYEYDVDTNKWSFVSSLYTGTHGVYIKEVCMCYYNNKIYYVVNSYSDNSFFYYDLDGAPNNYHLLTNDVTSLYHSMVSDNSGYIYRIVTTASANRFVKYSTSSDTWHSCSNAFDGYVNKRSKLVYDDVRNVIYYIRIDDSTYHWVQRYNISYNTWDKHFFSLYRLDGNTNCINMEYYDNKLYFCNSSYGKKLYVYNIDTDVVSTIDTEFVFKNGYTPYAIAVQPTMSGVSESIYCFSIQNDVYKMFGVNTITSSGIGYIDINKAVGSYTSTVISVDDPFKSSYFVVESETTVGKTFISTDEGIPNGIVEVRSSNEGMTPINEIYWPVSHNGDTIITKYTVGNDTFDDSWSIYDNKSLYIQGITVCRRTGRILISTRFTHNNHTMTYLRIINRDKDLLYEKSIYDVYNMHSYHNCFDAEYGVWLYYSSNKTIKHRKYNLDSLGSISVSGFYALAAQLDSDGAWYTERNTNTLVKLNRSCNITKTVVLGSPYGVCGATNNGCWVVDTDIVYGTCIKKYSSDANLLQVIKTNKAVYRISDDHHGGFYALTSSHDGEVWHYNKNGDRDMVVTGLYGDEYLKGGRHGVVLYSSTYKRVRYLDLASRSIIWTQYFDDLHLSGSNLWQSCPDIFSYDAESEDLYRDEYGKTLLPVYYDSVWYGDSNLTWKKVPKDGYFLPKVKNHQIRVTLRNLDGESTPILKRISMAPAEKINDINPHNSKPIYVRSDIPADASASQFDTRIKVWWDIED